MPEAILGPVAGAVVGGMMSDGGGGGSQTASKEPWSEAAPWLRQNLQTGQALQQYYQQNPFNQQQQTGYQNLFSDLDRFRSQMAPGLMQFANQAMNSGYQRPQYSQPGTAGYGQPSLRDQVLAAYRNTPGAEVNPSAESVEYWMKRGLGGFADEVNRVRQENPQLAARIDSDRQRLYGRQANQAPQGSPFSVAAPQPQQLAGLLNFKESNPFTAQNGIQQPNPKTVQEIIQEEFKRLAKEAAAQQASMYYSPGD